MTIGKQEEQLFCIWIPSSAPVILGELIGDANFILGKGAGAEKRLLFWLVGFNQESFLRLPQVESC